MKIRNTITKLVTLTIVVAAMAVLGTGSARAQHVRVFDGMTFAAVIPAQELRFSVYDLCASGQDSQPARTQVSLYDAQGNVLARSQAMELLPGKFRIIDFNRADLSAPGEPGTGRLQVRASIQILLSDGSARVSPEQFLVSMEVVDNRTGRTIHLTPISVGVRVGAVDR